MKTNNWSVQMILNAYVDAIDESTDRAYIARTRNIYTQMMQLLFEKQPVCGDLMTVERFASICECGGFNNYDGFGYYLDWDGKELGPVNCSNPLKCSEKAVFVDWYNK